MDFTDQHKASKQLSRHMNSLKAVGSAETVNIRRLFSFINNRSSCERISIIPTGSKAEGFDFDTSDTDKMLVLNTVIVIQEYQDIPDGNKTVFAIDNTDCSPGFTLLKLRHLRPNAGKDITHALQSIKNALYISSETFLRRTLQPGDYLHGPCSTLVHVCRCSKSHEVDRAFSFHCRSWPDRLSDFRSRTKYCIWPPERLVNRIVQGGCHFVAIGDKHSNLFGMQWRISFAKAEKYLVMSFSHVQFKTYALLKFFLKEVIERDTSVKDLLCSYFMKTIVFHAIEYSESSLWVDENLLHCFQLSFSMLLEFVQTGYCPNYFIPAHNMFLSKVFERNREKLLLVLGRHESMGLMCLNHCPSLAWIFDCPSDDENTHLDLLRQHATIEFFNMSQLYGNINKCVVAKSIYMVFLAFTNETFLDFALLYLMNALIEISKRAIGNLEHTCVCSNKVRYRQTRKHRRRLQILSTISVCRGQLALATFYYNTGCYNKACDAADRVVNLCCQSYEDTLDKDYSILEMAQKIYRCYHFIDVSEWDLYPHDLDLEVIYSNDRICLSPYSYAVFLRILSSNRLRNVDVSRAYMADLLDLRTNEKFIDPFDYIIHNMIGICHQALGDTTLATQAFKESCRLFPENMVAALRLAEIRECQTVNSLESSKFEELDYCNVKNQYEGSVSEGAVGNHEDEYDSNFTKIMYNVDPDSFVAVSWF